MPGAACTRSLVGRMGSRGSPAVVTTSVPEQPGIPARNGFTACFVLSPAIGLFCHRRPADMAGSAPGWADFASARLDTSVEVPGPHDFTVRFGAVRLLAC
jgi:hypothetical protein